MTTSINPATDTAIDKVVKLIPAEIAAAFLAINGIVPDTAPDLVMPTFAVVLCVITYFYLTKLRGMTNTTQLIFVCLIAYPMWAINIAASRYDFIVEFSYIFASLLIVVSLLPPLIFRSET